MGIEHILADALGSVTNAVANNSIVQNIIGGFLAGLVNPLLVKRSIEKHSTDCRKEKE